MTVRAVDALNAVGCANTELHRVRLLTRRAEVANLAIRAVSTRWTDVTLRVGCVCCPTCFASHARDARSACPAVSFLVKLVWIVAHQTHCLVGRWRRTAGTSLTRALPTCVPLRTVQTFGVHRIWLFPVRTGTARDAVWTVLSDRGTVTQHFVHTWITHTTASSSAQWTGCTTIVCIRGLRAVRTHITSHKVVGETAICCAGRIDSIGTSLADDSGNTVSASCAKIARCTVGVGLSSSGAICAYPGGARSPGRTKHAGSRLRCIVGLLSIQTRTACAVAASGTDSTSLTASSSLVWLRTGRTDIAHTSNTGKACCTWLACELPFGRL